MYDMALKAGTLLVILWLVWWYGRGLFFWLRVIFAAIYIMVVGFLYYPVRWWKRLRA